MSYRGFLHSAGEKFRVILELESKDRQLKVAVLAGGIGSEREISLESGNAVTEALSLAGMDVCLADIKPDNLDILDEENIDVYFLALHGRFGEDGSVQQILENKGLVYTGCGPRASRICFDKILSKQCFAAEGIKSPKSVTLCGEFDEDSAFEILKGMEGRFVVKPAREGSSVGIEIVDSAGEAVEAARKLSLQYGDYLIEEFIEGKEITVGILGAEALPIIEVRPGRDFYDFQAKYEDEETQYLFDTIDDKDTVRRVQNEALRCFEVLGCRDFSRVDFMLTEDNKAYVLEINTIPGFTRHSLLPMAAAKTGCSMSDLCYKIVKRALVREATAVK